MSERTSPGGDRIRGLDELRGILILTVMLVHLVCTRLPHVSGQSPVLYDGLDPRQPWSVTVRGDRTRLMCMQSYAPEFAREITLRGLVESTQPPRTGRVTGMEVLAPNQAAREARVNVAFPDLAPYLGPARRDTGWDVAVDLDALDAGPAHLDFLVRYERGPPDAVRVGIESPGRPSRWMLDGQWLRAAAEMAMDGFFMLSGFLIMWQILRARRAVGMLWTFYARRALRILPLAWVIVGVVWLLWPAARGRVWPFALFVVNYIGSESMYFAPALQHLWSLCIEEQYYLLAPVLFLLCPRRHLWLMNAVIFALSFGWHILHPQVPDGLHTVAFQTHLRGYTIAAGQLIALWHAGLAPRLPRPALVGWGGGAALLLLAAVAVAQRRLGLLEVPGLALAAWYIVRCARGRSPLDAPILRYAGVRCYGLYLMHIPALHLLPGGWRLGLATTVFLGGLLLAVELSYRFFERPLLRLAPRYRFPPPAAASAGAP